MINPSLTNLDADITVVVYDNNMKRVAFLENAYGVGYEQKHNELWTAHFSLPADDEKNKYCEPFNFVEIYDAGERIELFRIVPSTLSKEETSDTTYQCEHVLVTLMDDILFRYHEIGGLGIYTNTVINYVLNKQIVKRWKLGVNEFARQFLYSWENENLLAALFSIPKPFIEDYSWTFDTTKMPWTLNLVRVKDEVQSYVRYKKNMRGVTRVVDPTNLCTRLYCLGYGEGINQLNIESINNGKPYLDAPTISKYGVIARVFADRRFEHEETLMARGQALLQELQVPRVSYSVSAADLHQLTNDPVDKFIVGTNVRIIDGELDIDVKALVVSKRKPDITGNPGDVELEIANKPQDIAGSISELSDRTRINEVYSQGATNIDSHDFADNCDQNYPAVLRFFIPEETIRLNKMTLNYQTESFRAYSRAIEGGGGLATSTESGGGSTQSSSSGGGIATSTSAGGGEVNTGTSIVSELTGSTYGPYKGIGGANSTFETLPGGADGHTHTIPYHAHDVRSADHRHYITIPDHTHQINIPDHTHRIEIPAHSHQISIPPHTHEIQHGIFQGPTPSSVIVRVDGKVIPGLDTSESEINLIPYLSKDGSGKVQRGWHEVTITPNNLGRITASIVSQFFVQSRGGGDY